MSVVGTAMHNPDWISDIVDNADPAAIVEAALWAGIEPTIVSKDFLQPYSSVWVAACGCRSQHYCVECKLVYDDADMYETEYGDEVCPVGHIDYIYSAACEHMEQEIEALAGPYDA